MISALLLGLVAGMRSMTPLAAVTLADQAGLLAKGNGAPRFLGRRGMAAGAVTLAIGELLGDKMRSAPDRIVAPGLAARLVTGALAGAAVARRRERTPAMILGATAAVAASYATFHLRMKALRRHGQTKSGLAEDAIALSSALAVVALQRRPLRLADKNCS